MAGQDTGQDKAKFVIVVGFISRPLGLVPKLEAIQHGMAEDSRARARGDKALLFEQTADRGAVNISLGR